MHDTFLLEGGLLLIVLIVMITLAELVLRNTRDLLVRVRGLEDSVDALESWDSLRDRWKPRDDDDGQGGSEVAMYDTGPPIAPAPVLAVHTPDDVDEDEPLVTDEVGVGGGW